MPRKQDKKRLQSDESDNGESRKAGRYGGSPQGVQAHSVMSVSDILSQTNSVLYDSSLTEEGNTSTAMADTGKNVAQPTNRDILSFLEQINSKLSAVDKKLERIEALEKKMEQFEVETRKLWNFIQDTDKKAEERLNRVEDKVETVDFNAAVVNDKVIELQKERDSLKGDITYLQSQSMRNNLVFSNIPEKGKEKRDDKGDGEEGEVVPETPETPEDTERLLRGFLKEKMKIAEDCVERIKFERVHRTGPRGDRGQPRRIVAKFNLFKEREMVRKQWKALEGTDYYVNEQFPRDIVEKRKKLLPLLKEAKKKGQRAWLAYDTLYIDGKPVKQQ